jgi:site-specific recombinase XerD
MSCHWAQSFVAEHSSPATRRIYTSDLKDLEGFLSIQGQPDLVRVNEDLAVAWRAHLGDRGLAPATIARKLAVAKGFFNYLLDLDERPEGLTARNPIRRLRAPRYDQTVGKTPCPGPNEVRKLLRVIGARDPRSRRDLLITLLLFNQGLRVSEVARLERSHVRAMGKRTYLALVGKGGAEIRSVLSDQCTVLLGRHLKALPAGGRFIFRRLDGGAEDRPLSPRTIHARLKSYVRRAGLDPTQIRPHSGRVFFITQSYLKTRDLERVARAVGHRELATTRRYLRLGALLEDHPAGLIDLTGRGH